MVTKDEFEREWKEQKDEIKHILFDFGCIKADQYRIMANTVDLAYSGKSVGYIDLRQVLKVR